MKGSTCPKCGWPVECLANGMTIKCRKCGHSDVPVNSPVDLYTKAKLNRVKPIDAFENELSMQSVFSKLALISLFLFLVSLGTVEMRSLTIAALAGFLMFSFFYGFFRVKNPHSR